MDFDSIKAKITSVFTREPGHAEDAPALPETAKDIYGGEEDLAPKEEQPEAEASEASSENKAPDELPLMNFDPPAEEKNKATNENYQIIPEQAELLPIEPDVFEESPDGAYEPAEEFSNEPDPNTNTGKASEGTKSDGFFSEFQNFLEGNDIPTLADDLVSKDFLDKMKEFYMHRDEGKPYYFHPEDAQKELSQKLDELRELERSWLIHRENISKEERILAEKEEKISDKAEELKYLLQQIKLKTEFNRQASPENFFKLSNGHILRSLSDLSASLRVMDDSIFSNHVAPGKNDFADWIKQSLHNPVIADEIFSCKSREEALKCLLNLEKV